MQLCPKQSTRRSMGTLLIWLWLATFYSVESNDSGAVCTTSSCEFSGTCITSSGSCDCTSADFSGPTCGTFLDQFCPHTAVANNGASYVHVTVPDLRSRTSLVFAVKGCFDAHLGLSSTQDFNNNLVEIVIGSYYNSHVTVRSCHLGCDLGIFAGTFLNCSAYRTFWVTWNTALSSTNYVTTVSLGLGKQLGVESVMTMTLENLPNVSHVGVASYDYNNLIYWVFDYPAPTDTDRSCLQTTTVSATTTPSTTPTGAETTPSTTTAPPISTETPTGATNLPSTSAAQSIVSSAKMATAVKKCTCTQVKVMTREEAAAAKAVATETATEMKKNLTVNVTHTSAYIRTKVSTSDERQSAQNLGVLGVVMLTAVLSLVLVPDLFTLTAYVMARLHSATWWRRKRRQAEREGRGTTPTARASQSEQEGRGETGV